MKHFVLLATLMITMCIAHSLLAQQKGYRIVAIDEAPGRTMDAALFATADQDTVKKYMPEGNAPASVTTFVLFAGEDTILFDAGLGNELWVRKLAEAGVKPESVKLVLLTHFHGDHIGGLLQNNARRFPNAKVIVAEPEHEQHFPTGTNTTIGLQPIRIKDAYGQDFTTFKFDEIVFENSEVRVKALDASGHTPGHAVFLIETKGEQVEKLLIIGDLLHAAALQFPAPEACARFDVDQKKAIAARKRILDFAAQEKIPVAGMHLPPPSMGTVKKNDQGGYDWEPNK
ncbi:MAG: MBL fold metallo-hydrolase [Planctomycetaceae bacterium]|nr:MBL fold metallo-hydrolase [Planctomycetaceae bacterium]